MRGSYNTFRPVYGFSVTMVRLPTTFEMLHGAEIGVSSGAGYDQIDIAPCTEKGIRVSNVPTAVDDATADVNMFLIIGALRNFNAGMISLRRGEWLRNSIPLGHDVEGKLLGILGMGGIGRNLKRKAEAFDMKIQYHNRKRLPEDLEHGAQYVSFDELLATSDVISLNLPLNVSFEPTSGESTFMVKG